jgi:hypothetical protein
MTFNEENDEEKGIDEHEVDDHAVVIEYNASSLLFSNAK